MDNSLVLWGLCGYVLLMLCISYIASRRQHTGDDFLLAGRNVSSGLTFGTTVATMIGTGTSMGAVGYAYLHGWAGIMYGLGGAVGILLTAWLFAPLRALRFMTMSEELSYYAGADVWVKHLSALLIFLCSLGWLGAHILGGALYLSWATGFNLVAAKWLLAGIFTLYVLIGGYRAVVWTDSLMALILFSGFLLLAWVVLQSSGGFTGLQHIVETAQLQGRMQTPGLLPALSLAVVVAVGVMAAPSFRQRIYAGASVSAIRRAFGSAGLVYLLFAVLPAVLGIVASQLLPDLTYHQHAFTGLITALLPPLVAILVLLAGLSATLSSASSDAIAAVSVLIRDLYFAAYGSMPPSEKVLRYSRYGVLLVSALSLLLALYADDIIRYISAMIATLMSGLFVSCILGRFWPRLNAAGIMAAIVSAVLVSLSVLFNNHWLLFWGNPVIPALFSATVCAIGVSLLTPASKCSRIAALALITAQREGHGAQHSDNNVSMSSPTPN